MTFASGLIHEAAHGFAGPHDGLFDVYDLTCDKTWGAQARMMSRWFSSSSPAEWDVAVALDETWLACQLIEDWGDACSCDDIPWD